MCVSGENVIYNFCFCFLQKTLTLSDNRCCRTIVSARTRFVFYLTRFPYTCCAFAVETAQNVKFQTIDVELSAIMSALLLPVFYVNNYAPYAGKSPPQNLSNRPPLPPATSSLFSPPPPPSQPLLVSPVPLPPTSAPPLLKASQPPSPKANGKIAFPIAIEMLHSVRLQETDKNNRRRIKIPTGTRTGNAEKKASRQMIYPSVLTH